MKSLKYIIFSVLATGLVACSDTTEDQISPADKGQIEFEINLSPESKTITDSQFTTLFEKGDEIGLFVVKRKKDQSATLDESNNFFHNAKLICLGGTKCILDGGKIEYAPEGEVLDFYAYYPYNPDITNPAEIAFHVSSDQNGETEEKYNYSQSDLLAAQPVLNVEKRPDGLSYIVYLKFKHLMSMVHVDIPKLQMNGVDLKGVGPRETLNMVFPKVKTGGVFNLITQEFELSEDEESEIIMHRVERKDSDKYFDQYSYRVLFPAQDIAANEIIHFEQDGIFYIFKMEDAVSLSAGSAKRYRIDMPITSIHTNPVEGGTFVMGIPDDYIDEGGNYFIEKPLHYVQLTRNYRMSTYTITNAQYALFLNAWNKANPGSPIRENVHYNTDHEVYDASWFSISKVTSGFDERSETRIELVDNEWRAVPGYENFPMTFVSCAGAKAFASWLGAQLPTEAEWEYACRAGTSTMYSFGDEPSMLSQYGWSELNTEFELIDRQGARYIGTKAPNPWGFYDMHGNCREWVADSFDYPKGANGIIDWTTSNSRYPENTSESAPSVNPLTYQGEYQLTRGGGWYSPVQEAFSGKRTMEPKNARASYHSIRLIYYY